MEDKEPKNSTARHHEKQFDSAPHESSRGDEEGGTQHDDLTAPLVETNDKAQHPARRTDEREAAAKDTDDYSFKRTQVRQNHVMVAATIVIAFAACVSAGVGIYQWRAIRDSSAQTDRMIGETHNMAEAMQNTANAMNAVAVESGKTANAATNQAIAAGEQAKASQTQAAASTAQAQSMKRLAGATGSSARAAEQSVGVAKDSLRIGERPSVGVVGIHLEELTVGKVAHAFVGFQNTGRTPARHVTAISTIDIKPVSYPEPKFSDNYIGMESHGSTAINAQRFAHCYTLSNMTADIIDAITQRKKWLFVYALLQYDDGRGDKYFTQYCGRYNPDLKQFEDCGVFNDSN